eukprot:2429941-Prymnesium_polylepis.3
MPAAPRRAAAVAAASAAAPPSPGGSATSAMDASSSPAMGLGRRRRRRASYVVRPSSSNSSWCSNSAPTATATAPPYAAHPASRHDSLRRRRHQLQSCVDAAWLASCAAPMPHASARHSTKPRNGRWLRAPTGRSIHTQKWSYLRRPRARAARLTAHALAAECLLAGG